MLRENYTIAREKGVIGYKIPIAPPNFLYNEQFFIAVSQTGIFGPFKQNSPVYENREELGFIRLNYDDLGYNNGIMKSLCPYRFNCEPVNAGDLRWGINFLGLQNIIGENPKIWRGIWEIELTKDQFRKIRREIQNIQQAHRA